MSSSIEDRAPVIVLGIPYRSFERGRERVCDCEMEFFVDPRGYFKIDRDFDSFSFNIDRVLLCDNII